MSDSVINQNRVVFDDLLDCAEGHHRARRYLAAAVIAEIAANYAMSHHAGLFMSPRLEELLQRIGSACSAGGVAEAGSPRAAQQVAPSSVTAQLVGSPERRPQGQSPDHVLHVLTRAQAVGGDTRMVWRWIRSDRDRRHSVALTRQGAHPVPPALTEAVRAAQGQVHVLNRQQGNLLSWSVALRGIASEAGMVVLHVHPYDVIPSLALADKHALPPVIFVDHADHAFWVGAGVSDLVAGLRESGSRLARVRRGISAEQSAVLPIVLPQVERTLSREDAKRQLGLPESAVLLLSIARPHKYRPVGGLDFLEGVLPALDECPDAHLWVVGPEPGEPWTGASERTRGRVRVLGPRVDTAVFYQAADVYVDAFPIVSITSLLEAGIYGLPLVSRCWPGAVDTVLCADTPGLARCLIQVCGSPHRELVRLVKDASYRIAVGEHTRSAIIDVHGEDNWQRALESAYVDAALAAAHPTPPSHPGASQSDELDSWLVRLFDCEPDLHSIIRFHLPLLPLDLRLVHWFRLLSAELTPKGEDRFPRSEGRLPQGEDRFPKSGGRFPSPGLLLPEWLGSALSQRASAIQRRST